MERSALVSVVHAGLHIGNLKTWLQKRRMVTRSLQRLHLQGSDAVVAAEVTPCIISGTFERQGEKLRAQLQLGGGKVSNDLISPEPRKCERGIWKTLSRTKNARVHICVGAQTGAENSRVSARTPQQEQRTASRTVACVVRTTIHRVFVGVLRMKFCIWKRLP